MNLIWILIQKLFKKVSHFLKQWSIELPHDLAIPLLGTDPREMKTYVYTKTLTWTHSIFIKAKTCTQCQMSINLGMGSVVHAYSEIFSSKKKWSSETCYNMNLENIMQSERSQPITEDHILYTSICMKCLG
jgi:hypothetical protein